MSLIWCLSSDIDECEEMSDNCNNTGPRLAECINIESSYECSCRQHTGYRLSSDGTTCKGMGSLTKGSTVGSLISHSPRASKIMTDLTAGFSLGSPT